MMELNSSIIICVILILIIVIYFVFNQVNKVVEWLRYAVVEAEKELGGETGQLKLRLVYNWFCEKFPVLAIILPFKLFSSWVDIALKTMKQWVDTNTKIKFYIKEK